MLTNLDQLSQAIGAVGSLDLRRVICPCPMLHISVVPSASAERGSVQPVALDVNHDGMPVICWTMMRFAMARSTPHFSSESNV
jgi:hypothetical protein